MASSQQETTQGSMAESPSPLRRIEPFAARRSKNLLTHDTSLSSPAVQAIAGAVISRSQRLAEKALEFPSQADKEQAIAQGSDMVADLLRKYPDVSDFQFRADRFIRVQQGGVTTVISDIGRLTPHMVAGIALALYRSKTGGGRDTSPDSHEVEDRELVSRLAETKRVDFAAEGGDIIAGILESGRMRAQAFFEHAGLGLTCRVLRDTIVPLEDLSYSIDTANRLRSLAMKRSGIGLITGVTGAGKSTTLASLIAWIKNKQKKHIVTIEEPIEYQFGEMRDDGSGEPADSLVTQQEVGIHVPNFNSGLVDAMRKRPNIIMVGEIRDRDTMETALQAAQTGHLVLSTMHTRGAAATLARILEWFSAESRDAILGQLSEMLVFILSQDLFPSMSHPGKLALCYEFMINSDNSTRSAILKYDGNPNTLDEMIRLSGGIAWDDQLEKLVARGEITRDFAANHKRRTQKA